MLWRVDPGRDDPVYLQLVTQVHRAILRGELADGERLPAAQELAHSLGVNIHTVLRAWRHLRAEGVLDVRPGRGAVVVAPPNHGLPEVTAALTAFIAAARRAGMSPDAALALVREELS
jgi:GntR family transcriptional regulator